MVGRKANLWSWSRLVRDHGEERALELLMDMPGLGEFSDHGVGNGRDNTMPTTTLEHHEVAWPVAGATDLDLALAGRSRRWWQYERTEYADGHIVWGFRDVSSRNLGCPFTGEGMLPEGQTPGEFATHVRRAHEARWRD